MSPYYGGAKPNPTPAMKVLLVHMQETGGWLREDPVRVFPSTLRAAERLGWAKLDLDAQGNPAAATITEEGKKVFPWP